MSSEPDEGPVYYREIQKNAYLKRIPNDVNTNKLWALGHKKPPLKAMWTLLCVHNGDTPFLEQYEGAESASTLAHRPAWRACLRTARHVTASVQPRAGDQYDFLVDTDAGPVRMLAPDWDTMQEWVTTLRNKLHELRILSLGQNVYAAPAAAPPPRAPARDPTSPLPPTPPVPPHRVPGIEIHTPIIRPIAASEPQSNNENSQNTATTISETCTQNAPTSSNTNLAQNSITSAQNSMNLHSTTQNTSLNTVNNNQNTAFHNLINHSQNSTSFHQNSTNAAQNSINFTQSSINAAQNSINFTQSSINAAQNSINFTQNSINSGPSSINLPAVENVDISSWDPSFSSLPSTSQEKLDPKRSVTKICGQNICLDDSILKRNVTDSDEEFFAEIDRIHDSVENLNVNNDYGHFKQRLKVTDGHRTGLSRAESIDSKPQRTNVTVIQVSNKPPHTAIPVLGPETDVFDFNFKQKLQVNEENQQNFINIVNTESHSGNSYGTVFSSTESDYGHLSLATTVTMTDAVAVKVTDPSVKVADPTVKVTDEVRATDGVYERLCMASTSNNETASPLSVRRIKMAEKIRKSSLPNLELTDDSTYEYLFPNSNNNTTVAVNTESIRSHSNSRESFRTASEINSNVNDNRVGSRSNSQHRTVNVPRVPVNALDSNTRGIMSNVERSHSQNAYDAAPRREVRRLQNSPKRDKNDRTDPVHPKPIWKRGLTELSLLSKLRGIGQSKRQESPSRHNGDVERVATSPVKVVRRSRPEVRVDSARRRSNSLSNGQSPPYPGPLQPLRARQAAALRAEQRRGACVPGGVSPGDPPVFCEYERMLWVARWGRSGVRCGGRQGDRVAALGGTQVNTIQQARAVLKSARSPVVDILFHRVPLGKIYVINRRETDGLGIKLDNECTITSVEGGSPAARAGIPPPGRWCITEVNNRPINLVKGGEEEINRLSMHGTEVSILIQPVALVKKIRAAIKSSKPLLSIR